MRYTVLWTAMVSVEHDTRLSVSTLHSLRTIAPPCLFHFEAGSGICSESVTKLIPDLGTSQSYYTDLG